MPSANSSSSSGANALSPSSPFHDASTRLTLRAMTALQHTAELLPLHKDTTATPSDTAAAATAAAEHDARVVRAVQRVAVLQLLASTVSLLIPLYRTAGDAIQPQQLQLPRLEPLVSLLLSCDFSKPVGAEEPALPLRLFGSGGGGASSPSSSSLPAQLQQWEQQDQSVGVPISWQSLRCLHDLCKWATLAQLLGAVTCVTSEAPTTSTATSEAPAATSTATSGAPTEVVGGGDGAPHTTSISYVLLSNTSISSALLSSLVASTLDALDSASHSTLAHVLGVLGPLLRLTAAACEGGGAQSGAAVSIPSDDTGGSFEALLDGAARAMHAKHMGSARAHLHAYAAAVLQPELFTHRPALHLVAAAHPACVAMGAAAQHSSNSSSGVLDAPLRRHIDAALVVFSDEGMPGTAMQLFTARLIACWRSVADVVERAEGGRQQLSQSQLRTNSSSAPTLPSSVRATSARAVLLSYVPVMTALALHREGGSGLDEPALGDAVSVAQLKRWITGTSAVGGVQHSASGTDVGMHGSLSAAGGGGGGDARGWWASGIPPLPRVDTDTPSAPSNSAPRISSSMRATSSSSSDNDRPVSTGQRAADAEVASLYTRGAAGAVTRVQMLCWFDEVCSAAAAARGAVLHGSDIAAAVAVPLYVDLHRAILLRLLALNVTDNWRRDNLLPGSPLHCGKLRAWQALTLLLSRLGEVTAPSLGSQMRGDYTGSGGVSLRSQMRGHDDTVGGEVSDDAARSHCAAATADDEDGSCNNRVTEPQYSVLADVWWRRPPASTSSTVNSGSSVIIGSSSSAPAEPDADAAERADIERGISAVEEAIAPNSSHGSSNSGGTSRWTWHDLEVAAAVLSASASTDGVGQATAAGKKKRGKEKQVASQGHGGASSSATAVVVVSSDDRHPFHTAATTTAGAAAAEAAHRVPPPLSDMDVATIAVTVLRKCCLASGNTSTQLPSTRHYQECCFAALSRRFPALVVYGYVLPVLSDPNVVPVEGTSAAFVGADACIHYARAASRVCVAPPAAAATTTSSTFHGSSGDVGSRSGADTSTGYVAAAAGDSFTGDALRHYASTLLSALLPWLTSPVSKNNIAL